MFYMCVKSRKLGRGFLVNSLQKLKYRPNHKPYLLMKFEMG